MPKAINSLQMMLCESLAARILETVYGKGLHITNWTICNLSSYAICMQCRATMSLCHSSRYHVQKSTGKSADELKRA